MTPASTPDEEVASPSLPSSPCADADEWIPTFIRKGPTVQTLPPILQVVRGSDEDVPWTDGAEEKFLDDLVRTISVLRGRSATLRLLQSEHLDLQRAYEEQRAVVRDLEDRLLSGIHIASPYVLYAQGRYNRACIGRQNAYERCKRLRAAVRQRNVALQESQDLREAAEDERDQAQSHVAILQGNVQRLTAQLARVRSSAGGMGDPALLNRITLLEGALAQSRGDASASADAVRRLTAENDQFEHDLHDTQSRLARADRDLGLAQDANSDATDRIRNLEAKLQQADRAHSRLSAERDRAVTAFQDRGKSRSLHKPFPFSRALIRSVFL